MTRIGGTLACLLGFGLLTASCGGGSNGDPAGSLTSAITFGGGFMGTLKSQAMAIDGTNQTVQVNAGSGTTTVMAGNMFMIPVVWTGGSISGVNVGFSNATGTAPASFYNIPVSQSMQAGAMVMIPTMLNSSVCSNLASIQHMIRCYEQVVLPDGTTVSKAAAQMMILDCPMQGQQPPPGQGTCTTNNSYCNGKTLQACVDGNAQNCWYIIGSNRYNCNGCDCQAAAMLAAQTECH